MNEGTEKKPNTEEGKTTEEKPLPPEEEVDIQHEERQKDFEEGNQQSLYDTIVNTIFGLLRTERLYYKMAGEVNGDGTVSIPFFGKLHVAKSATGTYVITHNFRTQSYTVQVTPKSTGAKLVSIYSKDDNSVTIKTFNSSFAAEDIAFDFVLFLY